MTTSRELTALDTNVLIYALYADAEHLKAARLRVDQARSPNAALCLTPSPPSSPCLVSYFYHFPLT
jgi:hypothetical protein